MIGEELFIGTSSNYISLRNLQNPKSITASEGPNPNTYHGDFWRSDGEPHNNSTILSHWFYLLSEGGSGTNDNSDLYSVSGIGMEKAANITFRAEIVYFTSTTNYNSARTLTIQAAKDIYGANSIEALKVCQAWYAVGVGSNNCSDTYISGADPLCGIETYTLVDALSTNITWSVSTNNLKILPFPSPTNTTVTVAPKDVFSNGIGYIEAHTPLQTIHKEIWVGSPQSSSSGLSSYGGTPVDTDVYMNSYDVIFAPDISDGAQYEWKIAYNNNSCLNDPNAVLPYFVGYGSNHIFESFGQVNIAWGNCSGTFTVLCYAVNSCGDRYLGSEMVDVHGLGDPEPCDDLILNVYPNPSNSYLHVNIIAPPPCDPIDPLISSGVQVIIYDLQGNVEYSENFGTSDITIENMNLNQGNHILNVQTTTGQSGQEIIVVE